MAVSEQLIWLQRAPSWQSLKHLNDCNLGCAAIERQNCYFDFFNLLFACRVWRQCAGQETVRYVGIRSVSAQSGQWTALAISDEKHNEYLIVLSD